MSTSYSDSTPFSQSMLLPQDKTVKVFIQRRDGLVYEVDAAIMNLTYRGGYLETLSDAYPYALGKTLFDIELRACNMVIRKREDAIGSIHAHRSSNEWKCDYCGGVSLRENANCVHCGALRSFVYDL